MVSGAAFHRAYHRAIQQAFLEAHEHAFRYFGGVFRLLRYDNLKSAVKQILRGHRREETTRFIAFRSHWRFASDFCTPAQLHEKSGIEGKAGYFQRNHWQKPPRAPGRRRRARLAPIRRFTAGIPALWWMSSRADKPPCAFFPNTVY